MPLIINYLPPWPTVQMTYAVSTDCLVSARLVILRVTINRGPPTSKELCPQDLKSTSCILLSNSSFSLSWRNLWKHDNQFFVSPAHGSTWHLRSDCVTWHVQGKVLPYWSVWLKRNMILRKKVAPYSWLGLNFFLDKKRIILDYNWVHHHFTSTLKYTTYIQILIFIYIVPTLCIAPNLKPKPIWPIIWMTAQANTRQEAWEHMPNEPRPTLFL